MFSLSPAALETAQAGYTRRNQVQPKLSKRMMKYVDAAVCYGAGVAFDSIQFFKKFKPAPAFTPKWTEKPC